MEGMRRFMLLLAMVLLVAWLLSVVGWPPHTPQVLAVLFTGSGTEETYPVVGPPTISVGFIDQVLAASHSPAAGQGQALYDLGVKYGIDPVYALAFFWHESAFGTTGEARATRSLGNERCIIDRPCIDPDRGGYAQMQSWEDGFAHWY